MSNQQNPKPKDSAFITRNNKEKETILTFKKLEPDNV